MKSHAFCFAVLSISAIVISAPAQAQSGSLTRSFVSAEGADTNPCTITQPCATFAHAYTVIGPSGIIAALDPGKYGPITITTPTTINGNGWAAITAPAQGSGITINATSGDVILTGLEVDGAGAAYNGIVFNSGTSLTISNCIVKDFVTGTGAAGTTGNGIWIAPTSGTINFAIVSTTAVSNANAGIAYVPQSGNAATTGIVDHVVATNNKTATNAAGVYIDSHLSSGTVAVSISNSVLSNNTNGIFTDGDGNLDATLDNDEINFNATGINTTESTIVLGRSTLANNSLEYVDLNGESNVYTYQNNQIYLNGSDNDSVGGSVSNISTH